MRRAARALAVSIVAVAPWLASGAASAATGAPAAASPHGQVRAIVTLAPHTPMPTPMPGVRVLDSFRQVDAEYVATTPQGLAALARDPRVRGISPNWRGHLTGVGNDGYSGPGVLAAQALGGEAGQPGTGAGVTVALLDTGVDDTAALNRASGRLVDGIDVSQLSAGGSASTTGPFTDGYGHGTFLASLIAGGRVPGSGGLAIGIAPAARVVVVKVAADDGTTSLLQVLAGLNWVSTHANAIQVVNVSLAVDRPTDPAYGADPLTAAIEDVRAAGVLVVASAGNTAGEVGDPGMDPQALTVGAADTSGGRPQVASFSGSGVVAGVPKPDLVAPGDHILGVESPDTSIGADNPSAWQDNGLFIGSGTSEATAVVSGVAAAYLSDHPQATPLQVKTALRVTASPMGDPAAGTGLVTVAGGAAQNPQPLDDPTGEADFDSSSWQANAWLDGQWQPWMAAHWETGAWSAGSWSAGSWSAGSWSAGSWSAGSWSAGSWSDASWGGS